MIGEKQLFFTNTKPRSPYVAHTLPESKDCVSVALAAVSSEAPSAAPAQRCLALQPSRSSDRQCCA